MLRSGMVAVPGAKDGECRFGAIDDRRALTARIDRRYIGLVGPGRLEGLELAVDHRSVHEVGGPPLDPPDDLVSIHDEIEEAHVPRGAQRVAVAALERRAGDHCLGLGAHRLADRREPRPAIGVGERDARCHLGDIRLAVERVGLDVRDVPMRGKGGGDGRLSRARDAHDDDPAERPHPRTVDGSEK